MVIPTRIHLLASLDYGGNEALALELIQSWPERAQHVVGVIGCVDGPMRSEFQSHANVDVLPLGWPAYPSRLLRLWRWIGRYCPDSVVSYTFNIQALPLCVLARCRGVSSVAMRVGNPPPSSGRLRSRWALLIRLCRWTGIPLMSCSVAVHNLMAQLEPLPHGSSPILNGCNTRDIAVRARSVHVKRSVRDTRRIIMVARLDTIKDQANLLMAFAQSRKPGWQLVLVGEGPERPNLELLASKLSLDPLQVFLGRRSDIPELLGHSDIFAFSTTSAEGFGIALIEAMAAGLPIVASDVPACREILHDGKAGTLLSSGDVGLWAKYLGKLMESSDLRTDLAENASAYASSFDSSGCAQRWLRFLTS